MSLANIGKGVRYLLTLNIIQMLATVIFFYVAAHVLSEADIGLIATLTFTYSVLTILSSLALPTAGTKYIAEFLGSEENLKASAAARSVLRLVLLNAFIVAVSFHIVLILVIGGVYGNIVPFSLVCIASFLASLKLSHVAFLQGLQLFDRYITVNLSTTIASYLVGVFLVLKLGLTGFALGTLIGEVAGLTLALLFYHNHLPKTAQTHGYRELLRFSTPIFVMQVAAILSDWTDRILFLALTLNLALLGVYDLSVRTAASILVISGFVEGIALSILSRTYGQTGEKNVAPLLKRAIRYLGFIYFPTALGLAAVSKATMIALYGQAYSEGSLPLAVLSIVSILTAFSALLSAALKSIGKTGIFIKVSLGSLVTSAVMVIGTSQALGIMGAALARVSAALLVFALTLQELRHRITVEVDVEGVWKSLLASAVSSVFLFLFTTLLASPTLLNIFFGLFMDIILYGLTLLMLGALRREDFLVFRRIAPPLVTFIDAVEQTFSKFIK